MSKEPRLIAAALTDINGYLPTHIRIVRSPSGRTIPSGMPSIAATAATSSTTSPAAPSPAPRKRCWRPTAWTWAGGKYLPVKNVFVPLFVNGRRYGNFELAYRDEAASL
jgi:methyl-accepting chemotaxis protein